MSIETLSKSTPKAFELQPGTSQWECKTVGSYVGNSYITRTETVYKSAKPEYRYKNEAAADTSSIDSIGSAAALCVAAAVATAIFFSLVKELKIGQ